jgi:small subunit ribosomal protein S5
MGFPQNKGGNSGNSRRPRIEEQKEFDQRILELARVTRVTKGGKRMRFRACVIIGDGKGRVGYGVAKGGDVQQAVSKAVTQAKKDVIRIPLVNETLPYAVSQKFGGADVILKPAPKGSGVKAGGAVRVVMEMAGVPNASAKILGSSNKINNTKATILALKRLLASAKSDKPAVKAEKQPDENEVEAAA